MKKIFFLLAALGVCVCACTAGDDSSNSDLGPFCRWSLGLGGTEMYSNVGLCVQILTEGMEVHPACESEIHAYYVCYGQADSCPSMGSFSAGSLDQLDQLEMQIDEATACLSKVGSSCEHIANAALACMKTNYPDEEDSGFLDFSGFYEDDDEEYESHKLVNGDTCSANGDCKSNYCNKDKVCATKDNSSEDDQKIQDDDNESHKLVNGDTCSANGNCKSNYCNKDKVCATKDNSSEDDQKIPDGSKGGKCLSNGQCNTGLVCNDNNICEAENSGGDQVIDEEAISTLCTYLTLLSDSMTQEQCVASVNLLDEEDCKNETYDLAKCVAPEYQKCDGDQTCIKTIILTCAVQYANVKTCFNDDEIPDGSKGGKCLDNGQCNTGLVCNDNNICEAENSGGDQVTDDEAISAVCILLTIPSDSMTKEQCIALTPILECKNEYIDLGRCIAPDVEKCQEDINCYAALMNTTCANEWNAFKACGE